MNIPTGQGQGVGWFAAEMLTDCLSTQKEQLLIKKTWAISALSENLGESEFIYSNIPSQVLGIQSLSTRVLNLL